MKKGVRLGVILPVLLIVLALLFAYSLVVGAAGIEISKTLQILFTGRVYHATPAFSAAQHTIIWNLRLPRTLMALLVGSVLAVGGMVYQALFRNPMADPYVLGISSGAAFGVALGAYVGFLSGATGMWEVPAAAFGGSLLASLLIILLSGGTRRSQTTLLLTGIALNFFLSALMTLLMYLNRSQLQAIMQWTMGSFSSGSWDKVAILAVVSLITIGPLVLYTKELDILLLNEDATLSLGVSVKKVRLILLLLSTFGISVTVAFSGVIGFVGLMVPHIFRLITGPKHKNLLLLSLVGGPIITLASDIIAKTAVSPSELPVGVITALAGTPLFFILLVQYRRNR